MSMERPIPGISLSWQQLGGVAGIVGVALFVIGVIIQGDAPTINDSVEDAQAYYADHGQRWLIADFVIAIGVIVFLLPFFTILRSILAAAEGGLGHWSRLSFYGALFFMIVGGASASFSGALAVAEGQLGGEVVRALQHADFYAYGGLPIVMAPFFFGTAMVVRGTGVFWRWLAWPLLALAIVAIIGAYSPAERDPEGVLSWISAIAFLGLGVSVLLLSAAMLSKGESRA